MKARETCEKFDGVKEFIRDEIEEICSNEKLSVEEILLVYEQLRQLLKLKLVAFVKTYKYHFELLL